MVLDTFINREKYFKMDAKFEKAFAFLEDSIGKNLSPGKYEIEGDEIFASVQEYETSDEGGWEAHRKYIDIQFVLEGKEIIEWGNIERLSENSVYHEENDFLECDFEKGETKCKLEQNDFMILWPEDIHKPKCIYEQKCNVRKIVVKVAV